MTARLDIYIKERSVALISLAKPRSRPPAAWRASALTQGQVKSSLFPNLKSADAEQSTFNTFAFKNMSYNTWYMKHSNTSTWVHA